MTCVLLEISEGHVVRNLLENGLLDLLSEQGADVILVTPGARVPSFSDKYASEHVVFIDGTTLPSLSRYEGYEFALGQWLSKKGQHWFRRMLWEYWGQPNAAKHGIGAARIISTYRPNVVVSTHVSQVYGRYLVACARQRHIPTVGNLNSWDNAWKGLKVRPDIVTCWSENSRLEICRLASYKPERVKAIGAPAFDAYFRSGAQWSREELCDRFHLDPSRPILLFATLGQFKQQIDETNPLEVILRAIDAGEIVPRPQVVLRLHPWSRETYFKSFISHPDVVVSRYENYVPGLTWTPTLEETVLAGNLLRHADVCVSPGSTMCIEAAIFDTPTVIPAFNEYMPEVFEAYFRETWLNQHFGRLYEKGWVQVTRSAEDTIDAVNKAMCNRTLYKEERRRIREEFLGPLDGQATQRFADVVIQTARNRSS